MNWIGFSLFAITHKSIQYMDFVYITNNFFCFPLRVLDEKYSFNFYFLGFGLMFYRKD